MSARAKTEARKRASDPKPLALVNARLIDPASGRDEMGGVLIENGAIADIGPKLTANPPKGSEVIDCDGHVLSPGLIDMRVFICEPGNEHRETLGIAGQAAAAGGVTTIVAMPNTDPVIDDVALVDFLQRRARDTSPVNILPMAALTKGLDGERMTELGLLSAAGAVAFSDGGVTIADARLLRRAMEYGREFGCLFALHAEEARLKGEGVMNEGEVASRLGLTGIPAIAETIIVERDLRLAGHTGARLHIAQVSSAQSVDVLRAARQGGADVTAGVSAAHLLLNDNDIGSYRTFFKLSPPLRSEDDRQALIAGVRDGAIDVVVSSHNPQSADTKRHPFAEAEMGAIGLETLLPALLALYHSGDVPLMRLLECVTSAPARLLGLKTGRLEHGAAADLALIDLDTPWIAELDAFKSKSKNTPFEAHKLQGRALRTWVAGTEVYAATATA